MSPEQRAVTLNVCLSQEPFLSRVDVPQTWWEILLKHSGSRYLCYHIFMTLKNLQNADYSLSTLSLMVDVWWCTCIKFSPSIFFGESCYPFSIHWIYLCLAFLRIFMHSQIMVCGAIIIMKLSLAEINLHITRELFLIKETLKLRFFGNQVLFTQVLKTAMIIANGLLAPIMKHIWKSWFRCRDHW